MFIVRWKKGLESLNLKEDKTTSEEENENNSEEGTKEESRVILTRALRNKGYGKYQTYANFLDGEEKEQYEQYLKNKRKLAKKRLKEE